jgi:hypothetical protein
LDSCNIESIKHIFKGKALVGGGQKGLRINAHEREQTFLSQRLTDCVSGRRIIEILFKGQFILYARYLLVCSDDVGEYAINYHNQDFCNLTLILVLFFC